MNSFHTLIFFICPFSLSASIVPDTLKLVEVVKIERISYSNSLASPFTDLKYRTGKTLVDVLGEFSSVYIKSYGAGQLASLAIRGTSASQTEIQWNGIKLNSPSLGQCDLALFTSGIQDDLQLIRTGYRGAIGGTLRMLNSVKEDYGVSATGAFRAGSYRRFEGFGSIKYRKENTYGTTTLSYLTAENDFRFRNLFKPEHPFEKQKNSAVRQLALLQQFGANINAANELTFYLWLTEAERELSPLMSKQEAGEKQDDYSLRALLNWKGQYQLLKTTFTSALLHEGMRYKNPDAQIDETYKTIVVRNNFSFTYAFPFNLILNGELHYDFERANFRTYGQLRTRNISGAGIYLDYYLKSGVKFHTGIKADLMDKKYAAYAPEIAINYSAQTKNLMHHFDAAILASRNFRFPSLNDLYWIPGGNPNLKQEKSWNGELNFKYSYKKFLELSLSNFYIYANDWIQWVPEALVWTPQNFKRVFSRGAEVSIHITNDKQDIRKPVVHFNASYTYTRTTNLDAASSFDQSKGKQLIYVPAHRAVAGIQFQYRRFYLRSINSIQSLVFTSTDNQESLNGYFVFDVEVGKDFAIGKNEIGLAFRINNITDTQYQCVAQRPMPGRNFEGTIRYRLQ